MAISPRVAAEIARLMRDPHALRHEQEHLQPSGRRGHYDPNQPRVPAGHSDGGQWTDPGGGAGHSTYDRPQVDQAMLAGPTLGDSAAANLPIERVQARIGRRRPNPFELIDAARIGLYNEWSARNGPNQQAVIEFRAAQYRRDTADVTRVAVLSRSELGNRCPLREKVQELTDLAAAEVRGSGVALSAQQFGTAVHAILEQKIKGFNILI